MRTPIVLFTAVAMLSCSSPVAESRRAPGPDVLSGTMAGCYTVELGATPAPDVSLPTLIELSMDPAPGFVDPGRLAVKEPGSSEPRAPISSWAPGSAGTLDLELGGGFTGYSFSLRAARAGWVGQGKYWADFGVDPAPALLPVRLLARSC